MESRKNQEFLEIDVAQRGRYLGNGVHKGMKSVDIGNMDEESKKSSVFLQEGR